MVQPAMIDPPPDLTEADKRPSSPRPRCTGPARPSDVNRLILYLLEGTDFATGACYRVDGGRFLGVEE